MVNFFTPVALIVPSSSILKASIVTLSAEVIVLPSSKVKVPFLLLFASAVAVKLPTLVSTSAFKTILESAVRVSPLAAIFPVSEISLFCEAIPYSRNQRTVELSYSGSLLRLEPFCLDTPWKNQNWNGY